jgi:phage antirepressor YoqD-like protein
MIFSQSPKLMKIRKITDIVRLQRAIAITQKNIITFLNESNVLLRNLVTLNPGYG